MISIKSPTIAQAWRDAMQELYSSGRAIGNDEVFRDATMAIEVDNVTRDTFDDRFPMSQKDMDIISRYLVTGENEAEVVHDWTKIYRKRLFDENPNQIQNVIDYLRRKPAGKRAQASIWRQEVDLTGPIAPCLQLLWFQIVDSKLDIHVHMRASDCYGKLLMNMNEFAALQRYIAKELAVEAGQYTHFIDTCHFNTADRNNIEQLIKDLKTA